MNFWPKWTHRSREIVDEKNFPKLPPSAGKPSYLLVVFLIRYFGPLFDSTSGLDFHSNVECLWQWVTCIWVFPSVSSSQMHLIFFICENFDGITFLLRPRFNPDNTYDTQKFVLFLTKFRFKVTVAYKKA